MAECWNIDSVFVEVVYSSEHAITALRLDPVDGGVVETIVNGRDWIVRIGDIEVRIACPSTGARVWFEAWIGDTLVPPALRRRSLGSLEGLTPCAHRDRRSRDGYRALPDEPAIGLCGACHEPACGACLAIDRVTCSRCFAAATQDHARWDRQRRAVVWAVGSIASSVVAAVAFASHALGASAVCGGVALLSAVGARRAFREVPTPPTDRRSRV